jgi:hypothetical protein
MRRLAFGLVLFSISICGTPARADEASDARALAEQAIKAHGGATELSRMQRMTRTSTGAMFLFGQGSPFQDELTVSLPTKWRWTINRGAAGAMAQIVLILNGENAWQGSGAVMTPMSKDRVAELHNESQVLWFAMLTPLVQEKDLQLGITKDVDVNGRPARGIRVSRANKAEIRLYFDAQSHLLVKIARRANEAGLEIEKEYFYSDHEAVQGVMLPKKYSEWTGGRKFVEVNSITYKFHSSIDDKFFEKP